MRAAQSFLEIHQPRKACIQSPKFRRSSQAKRLLGKHPPHRDFKLQTAQTLDRLLDNRGGNRLAVIDVQSQPHLCRVLVVGAELQVDVPSAPIE